MAKQTPYRYEADAKEIIRNTHDFCKREKHGVQRGLTDALNNWSLVSCGFCSVALFRRNTRSIVLLLTPVAVDALFSPDTVISLARLPSHGVQ